MPSIMKGEVPMKLKSFDEFLSSLTEEDLDYITGNNDDEENNYVVKTTLGDPEAFNKLGALIAGFSHPFLIFQNLFTVEIIILLRQNRCFNSIAFTVYLWN